MMRSDFKLYLTILALGASACAGSGSGSGEEATSESADTTTLETFNLQARIFCPTGTFCGQPDAASLTAEYLRAVDEMNLEYIPTGISFRALPPIITQEGRFSTMTDSSGAAGNGETNDAMQADLEAIAAQHKDRITLFLMPNLNKCWNGIPCPGDDDAFDGDDVIYCRPPTPGTDASSGSTYAHEMGHYWCLRHTFTMGDPSGPGSVDHDGDDESCDSLTNVQDTPSDPGAQEGSDLDDDTGLPISWHEWCISTPANVDFGSPHGTSCTIECFQQIGDTAVSTGYHPLTEDAMSYWGWACRGPYDRQGVRHEAFTDGQRFQIQECRYAVPMRLLLDQICDDDSDHDGLCDDEDKCPGVLAADNADFDLDGFGDACDACPRDVNGHATNSDGDTWCNENDGCPFSADASSNDPDGDGLWASCDTCPNNYDPANADNDGDGHGDVCDPDDDNDGCFDRGDQHPKSDTVVIGVNINVNCPHSTSPHYGSEAGDSDGDGIRDCAETDDDNDGILDDDDECPQSASQFCMFPGESCPLNPIFTTCRNGGCNELLIKLVQAVNPDPTRTVTMAIDSVVDDHVFVRPISGRTIAESSDAVRGTLPISGRTMRGPLTMQLVDARGRWMADLATYTPTTVRVGSLTSATRLQITLPRNNGALSISGVR